MRRTTSIYTESLKIDEILVEENKLFSQETYHFQSFRYETLKSPLLKKTKFGLVRVFLVFTHQRMNEHG